jgi:hypothetical protein
MVRSAIAMTLISLTAMAGAGLPRASAGERLRVEWEQLQTKRGIVLSGYVYSDFGSTATNVQLFVETLDQSGQVIGTRTAYVMGTVPPFNRASFEIKVPSGAAYRVSVANADWMNGGGGGG